MFWVSSLQEEVTQILPWKYDESRNNIHGEENIGAGFGGALAHIKTKGRVCTWCGIKPRGAGLVQMDECAGSGHWWRAGVMTYRDSTYTASWTGKTQACENISFNITSNNGHGCCWAKTMYLQIWYIWNDLTGWMYHTESEHSVGGRAPYILMKVAQWSTRLK